ncbi:hypothetical protein BS50DRAFT_600721 [Corynespora cassiicola Philippines]|uniref:Initiation-specific alpha-1,6-mannosyltransferase n=1 Tax=Corynespora cassiicola Philippines TaxID=1448308 RepID=A0A2T2NPF8_CORCC|nr:hypothetical protein BS50DRAFT_600721 [Corynespora cassiicola Philippines]
MLQPHGPPRVPPAKIPGILWYKLGPSGLSNQSHEWTDTCIEKNPTYRPEFMTDTSADDYVMRTFALRPEIPETYLALTIPILKADMLRYLLLFDQGGIWMDLDVSCEDTPIDDWIPEHYRHNASLVVGWEFDAGWEEPFVRQFATWTIMSRPRSTHMSMVVDDIIEGLRSASLKHGVPIANLTLDMTGDVVDMTGPRRFTSGVLKSLGESLGESVSIEDIKGLREPKLVGDVLIMPGRAFASSSNKYEDKEGLTPPLVTHHYAGSWKNEFGGEQTEMDNGQS